MTATEKTDSTEAAALARVRVLALIERAQSLLYEAAQTACPLQGWVEPWEMIGDHADVTKALWHRVNGARRPTGHD